MATLVMRSERPKASKTEPVRGRVASMLNTVEKQVQQYIREQRVHDPLDLSPSNSQARQDGDTKQHGVACPRSVTDIARPFLNKNKAFSKRPSDEIPLQLIFDTPECRTQISPAESSPCQLNRRGATFHRVEDSVVAASERRNQQWSQSDYAEAQRESRQALTGSYFNNSAPDLTLGRTGTSSPALSDSPSGSSVSVASSSSTFPRRPLEARHPGSIFGPRLRSFESSLRNLHSRSHSLSHESPCPWEAEPCRTPPAPNAAFTPFQRGSPKRSSSQTSAPSLAFSSDDDHQSDPPSPTTTSESDAPQPARFVEPLQVNEDGGLETEDCDSLDMFEGGEFSNNALAAAFYDRNHPVDIIGNCKKTRLRWFIGSKNPPSRHVHIDTKGRKAPTQRSSKLPDLKRWGVGDSVTDLLSRKMFNRFDVQEIDTMRRCPSPLSESTKTSIESSHDIECLRKSTIDMPVSAPCDQLLSPPAKPITIHVQDGVEEIKPRPQLHLDCSDHVASAVAEEEVALSQPPRIGCALQPPRLATILEVSMNQDEDKEAIVSPARTITVAMSSSPSCNLPIPVIDPPITPSILHGPIRLSVANPSERLDWTAFQMAISGPTGDYLMGGVSGGMNDESYRPEEAIEDDFVDWFRSYGYESEGLLIIGEDEPSDFDTAFSQGLIVFSTSPVELPAGDSQNRRSTDSVVQGDMWMEKRGCKMSCNITDLGDFLNFESYHIGA
ncbi:MAG: hypothetical protein M1825_002311 [Sarcosagium campestre]|nr:MAG: hypothetical protein M1825_002311 [Sarcosagium campestre]